MPAFVAAGFLLTLLICALRLQMHVARRRLGKGALAGVGAAVWMAAILLAILSH